MNIPSFKTIDKITDSRYALVMLVSKRSRELVDGESALIDTDLKKPVSIAIQEAVEGAITFATEEEHQAQLELERQKELEEELLLEAEMEKEKEAEEIEE